MAGSAPGIAREPLHLSLKASCCIHAGIQLGDELRDDLRTRDTPTCQIA